VAIVKTPPASAVVKALLLPIGYSLDGVEMTSAYGPVSPTARGAGASIPSFANVLTERTPVQVTGILRNATGIVQLPANLREPKIR